MKTYGTILYVDGYNGLIKSDDGKYYIFKNKEFKDTHNENGSLKKGDYVSFIPEEFNTIETILFIARSVEKITKEDLLNQTQSKKGIN